MSPMISVQGGNWLMDPSEHLIWVGFIVEGVANLYFSSLACWEKTLLTLLSQRPYFFMRYLQEGSLDRTCSGCMQWPPYPAPRSWCPYGVDQSGRDALQLEVSTWLLTQCLPNKAVVTVKSTYHNTKLFSLPMQGWLSAESTQNRGPSFRWASFPVSTSLSIPTPGIAILSSLQ